MASGVTCPVNTKWLEAVLSNVPVSLATKLEPYVQCLSAEQRKALGLVLEKTKDAK
jgi:ABC-type uncharacterized transport system ATPase component